MSERRGGVDVFISQTSPGRSQIVEKYVFTSLLDCLDFLIFDHEILRKSEKKAVKISLLPAYIWEKKNKQTRASLD